MLGTRDSVVDAIVFFVAFHVLTAIDNIYAESIADFALRESEEDLHLHWKRKSSKIDFNARNSDHQLYRLIIKLLLFLYMGVYYYFMPFLINFVPYLDLGIAKH